MVSYEFVDILENNLVTQILWELSTTDAEIKNPYVKKLAEKLENNKSVRWDKDLISNFLSGVPEIKGEIESKGLNLDEITKLKVSITHEVNGTNAYDGIDINLIPTSIPRAQLVDFSIAYTSCFKGPQFLHKSKFTDLVETIMAEALAKQGITMIVGAGVDPYIPFAETLDKFSGIKFKLKKYLVSLLCTISILLPPSSVTKTLTNLLKSNERMDMITSNWSLSLERNNPPPDRFYNVRKVNTDVDINNNTVHLTFGVLKDPNELSQHLRNIGPKSAVFVVGSSLNERDFTRTGLGEHMSLAEWIVIFTLTPEGYRERLAKLMGKDKKEVQYITVVDDLHSIFRYITEVKAGRPPSKIL